MSEAIDKDEWEARVEASERAFDEHYEKLRNRLAKELPDSCRIQVLQTMEAGMDLGKRQMLAALRGEPGVKGH